MYEYGTSNHSCVVVATGAFVLSLAETKNSSMDVGRKRLLLLGHPTAQTLPRRQR